MSEKSGVRRIEDLDEPAYCSAVTVIMSREELDIILSIKESMAQRDHEETTVVALVKRKIASGQGT